MIIAIPFWVFQVRSSLSPSPTPSLYEFLLFWFGFETSLWFRDKFPLFPSIYGIFCVCSFYVFGVLCCENWTKYTHQFSVFIFPLLVLCCENWLFKFLQEFSCIISFKNYCCCFCYVCPRVVFLLLHILFSVEQVQDYLHNLCLQGLIVISVAISVFYVHGLYLFCCIFCFRQNRSLFPCIYAYRVVVFVHVFPFYQIKFLSLSQKKKKKNFVSTANCNLLASFGFVERLMGS